MANLSQQKRDRMVAFLEKIRQEHKEDDALVAINEIESEITGKKYGLVWERHEEAVDVMMRENIPVFTECKEKEISAAPNEKYNFILEGDNLHSLRLLEKTHKNGIDIIYIDPPYNGDSDKGKNKKEQKSSNFIYDNQIIDSNDLFRHSKWLSFMEARLRIAYNLLKKTGLIFISIDDHEQAPLKLLCDEIFLPNNFVAILHWKKKKQPSYLHGQVAGVMEYILIYAKNRNNVEKISLENPSDDDTRMDNGSNPASIRQFPAGIRVKLDKGVSVIKKGVYKNRTLSTEYLDDVYIQNGRTINKFSAIAQYRYAQEKIDMFCNEDVLFITKNYGFRRDKLEKERKKRKPITDLLLDWGDNQDSDSELRRIFGDKNFDYPKPLLLIKNIIKASNSNKNSIILDFFAGSGTTGHAVIQLNEEEGGNRSFILCTNNENKICEKITYERINRVIKGYEKTKGIPANVKYFRTDFVPRNSENLSNELLKHISEMVELEYGVKIDGQRYIMVLSDEELDNITKNWSSYTDVKEMYVANQVMFTSEQRKILNEVDIKIIPDYYFKFEMQEEGEIW